MPTWLTVGLVAAPQVVIVGGFLIQNYLTRRREIEVRLTERKQTLALEFMDWWRSTQRAVQAQAPTVTPQSVEAFGKWAFGSFFVASDEVVRETQELMRQLAEAQKQKSPTPFRQM